MKNEYYIVYRVIQQDNRYILKSVDRYAPCRYTSTWKNIEFDDFDKIIEYAKSQEHCFQVFVNLVNNDDILKSVKVK